MKWIVISGSWRTSSEELTKDVRATVAEIMKRGDGIVSGGALGVDQVATEEALRHDPGASRIKIIIPSTLEIFARHYRQRAAEGVITVGQAEALIKMLTVIKGKGALTEMDYTELNIETYYARNSQELKQADELLAFQVNNSAGTQDTIDKARQLGMPVVVKQYQIDS